MNKRELFKFVRAEAKNAAKCFFDEFQEPIRMSKTDWDSVYFQDISSEVDMGKYYGECWELFQDVLYDETWRLYRKYLSNKYKKKSKSTR